MQHIERKRLKVTFDGGATDNTQKVAGIVASNHHNAFSSGVSLVFIFFK